MQSHKFSISTCRHCKSFKAEGRRGGICKRFDTFASGVWESCSLAVPIFEDTLEIPTELFRIERAVGINLIGPKQPKYNEKIKDSLSTS